ncbi:MAG: ABC transporter permease [Planctomycetota bacterium]
MNSSSPTLRALAALLLVLALGAVFPGDNHAFYHVDLHLDLLGTQSVVGITAIGQCLVILGGGIDLSVGAVVGFTGMVFAGLQLQAGWPWPMAMAVALIAGAAFGAFNGLLVARLRVQPFLATLATMVIARGLARYVPELAGLAPSAKFQPADGAGPAFWSALAGHVGPVPVTGLLFALCAVTAAVWLQRSVFGRHLLATGGNPEAARLSGVATRRVLATTYVLSGVFAALAAVFQVVRNVQGDPSAGELLELQTIAAVVVGGTSLQGGRGSLWLAVLGVLTLALLDKVLSLNGLATHWRGCIQGVIILVAVLMQERRR